METSELKIRILVLFALLGLITGETAITTGASSAQSAMPPWRFQLPWKTETSQMTVGDRHLTVEVADTSLLRSRGLSYRDGLAPGTGMLFVFGEPRPLSFWMYEMRFCLDIIWIENAQIAGAAESVCPAADRHSTDIPTYSSPSPASYVLEVPAGWMDSHGFDVGTPVEIDPMLHDRDQEP
jgi:uncharacterized membrane protein (UPF0127 family)